MNIGFQAESDVPKGTVAMVGGRVVTMTRRRGDRGRHGVLIEGNRIKAVGPRGSVSVPAGAYVVDAKGKTVIPGLIDVHWHGAFGYGRHRAAAATGSPTPACLRRDHPARPVERHGRPSSPPPRWRATGLITAPRIFSTGTILYGANAPFTATIDSLEDARSHLRRMKAVGAFSVKSYNQPRRDQRQQVSPPPASSNMMVVPEGGSLFEHNMTQVVDGHTGIEHSIPVAKIYEDVRQLWKPDPGGLHADPDRGLRRHLGRELLVRQDARSGRTSACSRFVPREIIDERSRRRVTAPDDEWNHFNVARIAGELTQRGVKVNLGAHGQREGLGAHWELWMFVQGGMTPMQALRSATLNGARYLGMDKDIGSLEPGKLADVVVLDANPLDEHPQLRPDPPGGAQRPGLRQHDP